MGKGRVQYAALPWREADGRLEILLITSSNGRWIVPKGWPMEGKAPHEAAAQEAWEEAGVRGEVSADAIGVFHFDKVRKSGETRRLQAQVFPLVVTEEADDWPEAKLRERRWCSRDEAAAAVPHPELKALIAAFRRSPSKGTVREAD